MSTGVWESWERMGQEEAGRPRSARTVPEAGHALAVKEQSRGGGRGSGRGSGRGRGRNGEAEWEWERECEAECARE